MLFPSFQTELGGNRTSARVRFVNKFVLLNLDSQIGDRHCGCRTGTGGRLSSHLLVSVVGNDTRMVLRFKRSRTTYFMNLEEIKRDENGQNMFDRRCLL